MELLQTRSPSASHCIKCFCDFIRILCPCRCQSAVKLKLQTEILHFHPERKLRKSVFLTGEEIAWPFQLRHSLFGFEGSFGLLSWKGERKVALRFCWLWQSDQQASSTVHRELLSFSECNPFSFLSLSLSELRLYGRGISAWKVQTFQQEINSSISRFSRG